MSGNLINLLEQWKTKLLIGNYEILYVNDGSTDNTLDKLKEIAAINKNIKIISFSTNYGHQSALTAGYSHANGSAIVSLDADFQDPPEAIEEMILKLKSGYDIVYGIRRKRDKDTFFKKFSALCFYKIMLLMGVNLIYNHADYRLITKQVLNGFIKYTEINRFIRGLFPLMGFKFCTVEYDRGKRISGDTKYPFRKMLFFAVDAITSFSFLPLRFIFFTGFIVFLISTCLMIWAFAAKLTGMSIPGWTSSVLPSYFFGGIQTIFLGIIGEYIGKIYMEVKKRPLYLIKEKINF